VLSVSGTTVPSMGNSAQWAISAANSFREVARITENPTTKLLAEGLMHLAEGVRELDQQVETLRREVHDSN
jgi:hypothetical protein